MQKILLFIFFISFTFFLDFSRITFAKTINVQQNFLLAQAKTENAENKGDFFQNKDGIYNYNKNKEYFDYSAVLTEFPKNYYYTTLKINKSKERILIITDKVNDSMNSYYGLFYYFAKNGFAYPLGIVESGKILAQSKNYIYFNDGKNDLKFYVSDKKFKIIKSNANKKELRNDIEFVTIKSADKFEGDFGSPAGDDIRKVTIDGFYFEYHKPQYKRNYIKNFMQECINDGVKTQVQMYCCVVNKLHP